MNTESDFQVPIGFELAHEEWLARGGKEFQMECHAGGYLAYYRTRYWALVRQAIFARDSATCFRCQASAGHVHHLTYDFFGNDHLHPEALVSVCATCHQMVEYARLAEPLISRSNRDIALCIDFLEDRCDCLNQNAVDAYTRLLGNQDRLAELQALFAAGTPYTSQRESVAEANAVLARICKQLRAREKEAASFTSTWEGGEKEKAGRLLPMFKLELKKVEKFVADVLKPVSHPTRQLQQADPAAALMEPRANASGVEALVVGIKFHRGNADGIAAGESVQLVREPNNAYDPNAIRVNLRTGETLGYLTKEVAAVFAKQLDSGGDDRGQISKIMKDKVYVAVNPRRF